ncbi:hypothetical protein OKA05_15015 [Luteolibacter arcticus]|uniref:Uncharacterized protein n=1 Tax=Luteolibacter arcticus TaxID=1581411 RepID=A0ABT3GK26_9BACT|nr:hypothetical protein [Luteolibacter arcticus]MCW1923877.1 hypothetical protein [Luteolibacter arcticus]
MRSILILLLTLACARGQGAGTPGEGRGPKVRLCAFVLPPGDFDFALGGDKIEPVEVEIPTNGFSPPIIAPARDCKLGTIGKPGPDGKRLFKAMFSLSLPDPGKAFLVLLLPKGNTLQSKVIRADDPAIKEGDLHLFNLAEAQVALRLNGAATLLNPNAMERVSPPVVADDATYQVEFHAKIKDGTKLFGATRWGAAPNRRAFIFVFKDPKNSRYTYRAVEEFTTWTSEGQGGTEEFPGVARGRPVFGFFWAAPCTSHLDNADRGCRPRRRAVNFRAAPREAMIKGGPDGRSVRGSDPSSPRVSCWSSKS